MHSLRSVLPGHRVCRTAWMRFLGVGKERITRTRKRYRGLDERTINQGYLAAWFDNFHVYILCGLVSHESVPFVKVQLHAKHCSLQA